MSFLLAHLRRQTFSHRCRIKKAKAGSARRKVYRGGINHVTFCPSIKKGARLTKRLLKGVSESDDPAFFVFVTALACPLPLVR